MIDSLLAPMQLLSLQTPYLFTLPKPLNPPPPSFPHRPPPLPLLRRRHHPLLSTTILTPKSFSSDEFPVDETLPDNLTPKDNESEDEARRRNWIERGWAPWEEILTPEADFARKSLNEGEEVPLKDPETVEAFKMLKPSYRRKKMEEMGMTEEEYSEKQFEIKGEIPEPLETLWAGPTAVMLVPPRDWPPRGWEVDREELAFMREAHKMLARRVRLEELEEEGGAVVVSEDSATDGIGLERYKVFLKQYEEWVEANRDRLEQESYEQDQDYHPGRRKRGKDYKEGMYELPFYYPGQICEGMVTTLHLYQGAFVDIGGVYDGWVPIKNNDWYWIRHHIKVGMHVMVEIVAKRDPYRFRFPIELRFLHPNIDHLIFNRFDFPPIFHRDEDTNPDELRRDCGRPPVPRKDPGDKPEEEPLLSNHPYVDKLWQINAAEQMILADMEKNPDKYKGKKLSELADEEEFDEQNAVQHTQVYYKNSLLPKTIVKQSVKELDLEAAYAEHQHHKKLWEEAKARVEEYKVDKLRRHHEMDEYDYLHWRRSFEEREALLRDISNRKALGMPLEEPGRYVDASFFGKDQYDPESPLYRYDYWGEPKNSEKSRQERIAEQHNKSIVGKGNVWYEMSYEDAIKQQELRRKAEAEKRKKEQGQSNQDKKQGQGDEDEDDEDSDYDSDDDFDFSLLSGIGSNSSDQIHVNGTESFKMSDEGMFEE